MSKCVTNDTVHENVYLRVAIHITISFYKAIIYEDKSAQSNPFLAGHILYNLYNHLQIYQDYTI